MTPLLIIHAAITWAMIGVISTVQMLVYPSMAAVPEGSFRAFEEVHQARISRLLLVFAPAEVVTALAIFLMPGSIPRWLPLVAGLVLAGLWVATAVFYAPIHARLARSPDASAVGRLIRTNRYRTLGWTARGALVLAMVASAA